jgi:hypothetical protein
MTVAPDWWLTQSHRSQSLRSSGNITGTSLSRCLVIARMFIIRIQSRSARQAKAGSARCSWETPGMTDAAQVSLPLSRSIAHNNLVGRGLEWGAPSEKAGSRPDHPFGGRQAAGAAARRGCRAARAPPAPTTPRNVPRNVACQPNRPFTSTPTATPATIARVSPPVIIDRRGQTAGLDPVRRHTLAAGMAESARGRRAARTLHGLPPVR